MVEKIKNFFKNKSEINLTDGDTKTLIKKFLIYALPIIIVGILELLYNSFDLIVVQQKEGTIAGAAVGANGSLIALITNGFIGLSVGANVVISRYYGKGDKNGANRALHSGLLLATICGIIVGITCFFLAGTFLKWMDVSETYIDLSTTYLSIYFLSVPFMLIYNFGAAAFRGVGDSKKPLLFLAISGVLNIALNYLFVFGFNLSVMGVAIATVISQFVSAFLVILFLYINKGFIRFRFKELRFHKHELKRILQIGIPSGIHGIIFSISNVILQTTVNSWPPAVVTANTDAANIENYTYTAMYSISTATPAFISANVGRGFYKNIKKIEIISLVTVVIVGIVLGCASLAFSHQLLQIYMGANYDSEVVKYAIERMTVVLLTYFLCGLMDTQCDILRGLGYSFIPTIYSFVSCCVLRIIWNYFVYSPIEGMWNHSLGILYLCYPVSWIIAFLLEFITFFILRKRVKEKCDKNLIEYNKKHGLVNENNKLTNENKEKLVDSKVSI